MRSAIASRMMLPALGVLIVPLIVLLSAGNAAGRAATTASWTVQPGQTLTLSHMTILSANGIAVEADVSGTSTTLGTNSGYLNTVVPLVDYRYTNDTTAGVRVTVLLRDYTCTANYRSDESSGGTTADVDHVNTGYVKGKTWMAMASAGAACESKDAGLTPALDGSADFTAMYTLSRAPRH